MQHALSTAQQRNIRGDYLRGIAAIMVIAGHLIVRDQQKLTGTDHFLWFLYSVHMPVFFLLAGWFFPSSAVQPFTKVLGQKAARLLIPYFSWSTVAVAAKAILGIVRGQLPTIELLMQWLDTLVFARSLWFFLALFAVYLLYWCVLRLWKCNALLACAVLLAAYFLPLPDVLALHDAQAMIPYFGIGLLLSGRDVVNLPKKWGSWFAVGGAVLVLLAAPLYVQIAFDWRRGYGLALLASGAMTVVTTAAFVVVALAFGNVFQPIQRFFAVFGRYSLEIYCIHMFFVSYLPIPLPEAFWSIDRWLADLVYLIIAVLIGLVCVAASWLVLNRISLYRYVMLGQLPAFKRKDLRENEQLEK